MVLLQVLLHVALLVAALALATTAYADTGRGVAKEQIPGTPVTGFKDGDLPLFPFGFYQYTVTKPADQDTTTTEAISAMNLVCPYVSTSAPTEEWYTQMTTFMDRAAQTGFKVGCGLDWQGYLCALQLEWKP